jgi:hypothetical protein
MNFTYKNPNIYDKKYAILKQLEADKRIKASNEKSIINSLKKKDFIKFQQIDKIMVESKELANDIFKNNDPEFTDVDRINYKNGVDTLTDLFGINTKINTNFNILENVILNNTNSEILNEQTIIPYNVDKIHKKGIKIIYNVYQSKYSKGAINGTGFGDFIRGSYFLLEFCEKYNFECKILFNNCISKFLKNKTNKINKTNKTNLNIEQIQPLLSSIQMFHNNNFKEYNIVDDYILHPTLDIEHIMADFVDYMMDCNVYNGHTFIYCIPYPIDDVSEKFKEMMRNILEPIDEIKYKVQQTLQQVKLNFKNYEVFHIRSGDDYLNKDNKIFYHKYLDQLKNQIHHYIRESPTTKYLVIADNNEIKFILKKHFPNIKIILKEITHFGEGNDLEEEKVKNTLIDFYLLSFAKKIISLSTYKHGSGFSYWCAKTFNIPYVSKYITSL